MTTTDDDVFVAFERWAEERGVRFARDACVVKRDAHRGAWIEGARDGGRGEILLVVPKSACLSTTTSALGEGDDGRRRERLREMGVVGLVACVARERAAGENSAFAAYAATLPWDANRREDGEDAREVRALSRGTTVEVMRETDEEMLMRDHESVVEFYANEIGEEGGAAPTELEFRQAAAVVASRAFFIDEDAGQGLVPYADLFNHRGSGGRTSSCEGVIRRRRRSFDSNARARFRAGKRFSIRSETTTIIRCSFTSMGSSNGITASG